MALARNVNVVGRWLLVITIGLVVAVEALQSLKEVEEGPCEGVQYKVQENINITWLASVQFPYVLAGSKYHLYRFVKYHHKKPLKEVPDYHFYYDACIRSYANLTTGQARIFGFNGELTAPYLLKPTAEHGVLDFIPTEVENEIARHHLTLTDNKSYALFANCWLGPDQRSWDLISTDDSLSPEKVKNIEEHLISLGFDRKHFIFFKNHACDSNFIPTA